MPNPQIDVVPDAKADGWFHVRQPLGIDAVLDLRVRAAPDGEGGLRIRELHVLDIGKPLTGNHLRRIPLAAIENEIENVAPSHRKKPARDDLAHALDEADQVAGSGGYLSVTSITKRLKEHGAELDPIPEPRRGRKRPDAFYQQVAEWYREALQIGKNPTPYIQAKGNVERSTATSWIQTARGKGFLRSTQRGRARA